MYIIFGLLDHDLTSFFSPWNTEGTRMTLRAISIRDQLLNQEDSVGDNLVNKDFDNLIVYYNR